MYQKFLQNAARNALAAGDIKIYERAWAMCVGNLGSEQAVRNLMLPTPKMLSQMLGEPLIWQLDMEQVCMGLWIGEFALENPAQALGITWEYFPELAETIAKQIMLVA